MQDSQIQNDAVQAVVTQGSLVARRIADELAWGEGAIQPLAEHASAADQTALTQAVLQSIAPVSSDQTEYSLCTDGRLPLKLQSGDPVPVREQLVGADMVSAFYVAETLGDHFYKNASAPVAERVRDVAQFLKENGLLPSSHLACGAAAGFGAITANAVRFSKNPAYVSRLQSLLPAGVYDEQLHARMLAANETRLQKNLYDGLEVQTFLDAVEAVSGKVGIAELQDDGRGVHGHTEETIMRLQLSGQAIDAAKLAELTGGRQVFGVNDNRMERLARLFGRGNDTDYRIARMALEDFASTGHGTLAKNLPTYIVTSN
ncbi:MAG TPA: hypothetical protein VLF91_00150 [Candidatus Saccharimonadales bacterium]|nr:hypothetical protein [Candidatus Saccharimonadales bacterium]